MKRPIAYLAGLLVLFLVSTGCAEKEPQFSAEIPSAISEGESRIVVALDGIAKYLETDSKSTAVLSELASLRTELSKLEKAQRGTLSALETIGKEMAKKPPEQKVAEVMVTNLPEIQRCTHWEIKLIGARSKELEAGWEPVSGILYGRGAQMGVLLRRCIEQP